MADSDFVFEEGKAIRVGSHGEHDFVFAGLEKVTDSGKSTVVFESGTGIGGVDTIDDFNDGDMSEYADADYVSTTTAIVYEGSHALEMGPAPESSSETKPTSDSGLDRYPVRGDPPFRIYTYLPSGIGPSDQANDEQLKWGPAWATQTASSSTSENSTGGYELECRYHRRNDGEEQFDIYLTRDVKGEDKDTSTAPVDWSNYEDEWLYLEIDFRSGGNTVSLHRDADDSQIAQVSHDNTDVDFGGVGYFVPKGISGPILDFYHFP